MRVYQLKHYEVLLNDSQSKELALLDHHEQLCRRILASDAIAKNNLIEIARITSFPKMLYKPAKLERLMNMRRLPPFHFLIFRN